MPALQPLHLPQLLVVLVSLLCSHAFSTSIVTHLPGFRGRLPFHLETGYVSVDDVAGVQLFYYFIASEGKPRDDPVLLWLSGGPGCTAFNGLVLEIGPVKFRKVEYNGSLPNLVYFPHAWTKVANIIFLDSPVDAGFSFQSSSDGHIDGDISSSKRVYKFLRKWLTDHPRFISNPLYIAGDSYAGKIVPVITQEIINGIESGDEPHMNLKGYVIGNPITGERKFDVAPQIPYAHYLGIISAELHESITRSCEEEDYENPANNPLCATHLEVANKIFLEINNFHILDPNCLSPNPNYLIGERKRSLKQRDPKLIRPPPTPPALECRSYETYLSYYWANNLKIREALHVQKGTVPEWQMCNRDITYTTDIQSSIKYHHAISNKGYRALVYSGDHDLEVPHIGTQAWIKSLNSSIVDDWRSWFVTGQVAGYTRSYLNNLTFATIKGAGHTAPQYKPKQCLAMVRRWLSHKPL